MGQIKDFLPQSNLSVCTQCINMCHTFVTWKLTQLRPLTHFEKQCSDLMNPPAIQSENDPNTATNHQLTHNTLVAGVISPSLTHIAQYTQLPETVNTVKVTIEAGQMRGKSHQSVSLT